MIEEELQPGPGGSDRCEILVPAPDIADGISGAGTADPALVRRLRSRYRAVVMPRTIERIGHQARGFAEAEAWDREQAASLSLDERLRIAETLRRRAYGDDVPDVRESERRK